MFYDTCFWEYQFRCKYKSIFYVRHKIELINHQRIIAHIFIVVTSPSNPSPLSLSTLIEHITDITITTALKQYFFFLVKGFSRLSSAHLFLLLKVPFLSYRENF